jgi:lysylphosphatidylglycerol synthetase-like protein (DUF2156 family)
MKNWSRLAAGSAGVLVGVSFLALGYILVAGFVFDPDDYPPEYWQEQVGHLQRAYAASMVAPLAAVLLAVFAWLTSRNADASKWVALCTGALATLLGLAIHSVGWENIEVARRFATFSFSAG